MKDKPEEKLQILETLKSTPIVSVACAKVGIARATYYRWYNDDPEFKKRAQRALRSGTKNVNDLAYGKLIQKIREGSLGAITFYLGRRHPDFKRRDKVKVEIANQSSKPLFIPDDVFKEILLSDLPKRLRKMAVRKGLKLQDIIRNAVAEVDRKLGREPEMAPSNYTLSQEQWTSIIKDVLKVEK